MTAAITTKGQCPKCLGPGPLKPRRTKLGRLVVALTGGFGLLVTRQRAATCPTCGAVSRRRG